MENFVKKMSNNIFENFPCSENILLDTSFIK